MTTQSLNMPEPDPVPTSATPTWELVISYMETLRAGYPHPSIIDSVVVDMKERDAFGRQKYGTPLQYNNGRNHLVDAYQEALDRVVYLRNELERLFHASHPPFERIKSVVVAYEKAIDVMMIVKEASL